MDIKTLYGFALLLGGVLFDIAAHYLGVNGDISQACNMLIAAGLALIVGKEALNRRNLK